MDFHSWINGKINEWVKSGRSETQMALEIGINQATLNTWKNRTRGVPKNSQIIDKLIAYYRDDPYVFEVLGRTRPIHDDSRESLIDAGFPSDLVERLLLARSEYSSELARRGISMDNPEAREIIKVALERHGIHLTVTE